MIPRSARIRDMRHLRGDGVLGVDGCSEGRPAGGRMCGGGLMGRGVRGEEAIEVVDRRDFSKTNCATSELAVVASTLKF